MTERTEVRDHVPEIAVEQAAGAGPPQPGEAPAQEEVLVLDFGGQYSQLIARRIRDCGVFAELLPYDTDPALIRERQPKALVLSGGPASVYEPGAPEFPTELLDLGAPVLGICYGMQAMVRALGGRVEAAEAGGVGRTHLPLGHRGGGPPAGPAPRPPPRGRPPGT